MPLRDYRIRFLLDDAAARQATQRSINDLKALEQQAQKTATAVQKAQGGGGSGGGPSGGGGAGSAASRQAKAAADLDALQDRLILKDYNRRASFEARQIQSAERAAAQAVSAKAREAAQLDAIQDRYIQRDYRKRVAYEKQKIEQAEKEAERQEKVTMESAARREQFIVSSAAAVLGASMAGLQALNDGYAKIREDALAAAEATLTLKKYLRVEGTLSGDATPEETLTRAVKFRAETGLGAAEATEFTKQYEGTTPIAFEKGNITPKVAEELKKQAAIRAARQGGDAGTAGEMAGILGQFGKVKSAEAGLSQLEALRVALVKGRGDDSPLVRQTLSVAGSLAGEGHAIPSIPELGALIGVTSLAAGPGEAANRANQLYRGLKMGLTRQTKVKGTDQAQGAYLKGLDVGEKDTLEQTLDKVVPDLQKAKDSGRDLDAYLASKNFRASEQRRAIIETFENYAPLKQRMKEAREAGMNPQLGEDEVKKNKAYLESTSGRRGVTDALTDAATVAQGAKAERLAVLLRQTESSPEFQAGDQSVGTALGGDTLRGLMAGNVLSSPAAAGRKLRLEETAINNLMGRAKSLGVGEEELRGARIGSYSAGSENYTAEFVNQVEALITKHGGSNAIDATPQLNKMVEVLEQIRDQQAGGKGKAPAALPVAPPRANQRP